MKKRIGLLSLLILFLLLIILNLTRKEEGKEVEVKRVGYSSLISSVTGDGTLKAKSQVNVSSEVMGKINRLFVKEGDWVKKGDLLCLLDQNSYLAQYRLSEARLKQAKAIKERSESLYQKNLIAQEEYERAETEYKVAEANFLSAKDQYQKTEIRAPISGKVVKLNVEEGENVIIGTMNNPGTVLLTIADLSQIVALIDVSERDVVDIKISDSCSVELDALPGRKFFGLVSKIGYIPTRKELSEEKAQTFEVEITISDTSSLLRPGMTAHATIVTNKKEKVLTIPIAAVGKRKVGNEEKDAVFIVEKGKAKLVPVKTGIFGAEEVEIIEGLKEGDLVITGPYRILSHLRDGERVKIR